VDLVEPPVNLLQESLAAATVGSSRSSFRRHR
jgi:hypothetical protein